jgi:dTDP-4-dehydrorhamnose 3,5-epimerase
VRTAKRILGGAILFKSAPHVDHRGWLLEAWSTSTFRKTCVFMNGVLPEKFVQCNVSQSKEGVLRGLHFQKPPHEQGKLVRVLQGAVYDVIVDIRPGSPTYLKWEGVLLYGEAKSLWVPPGFAHGFLSLVDETMVLYEMTNERNEAAERTISWQDPELNIRWPLELLQSGHGVLLSDRDKAAPTIAQGALTT